MRGMSNSKSQLGKKLSRLRKAKGWTVYQACNETQSIKRESMIRMESGRTDPEKVLVGTMIQLIEMYWPDLGVEDFSHDKHTIEERIRSAVHG